MAVAGLLLTISKPRRARHTRLRRRRSAGGFLLADHATSAGRLGGEQQGRNGSGVLQRNTGHLDGVDHNGDPRSPGPPVRFRHDPLHELIEERNGKGCVAVVGTPDHAFGDQAAPAWAKSAYLYIQ